MRSIQLGGHNHSQHLRCVLLVALLLSCAYLSAAHAGQAPVDTWVISGQSNACGRAKLPGYEPHPLVTMFDGRAWVPAKEPLPLGGTVGPWLAAGVDVGKAGIGVKITGAASGGKPISYWDPNGGGWRALEPRIKAVGKQAGVFLWYQGESDAVAGMDGATYGKKLKELVDRVRTTAGNPQILVVIVQLALYKNTKATTQDIREAARQFVLKDPNALLVTAMGRACDGVHLTKEGYFELGHEIARALLKTRYTRKDTNWPGPVLDAAVLGNDGTSVGVHFAEAAQLKGLLAADFGVQDAAGIAKCIKVQPMGKTLAVLTLERAVKAPAQVIYGLGSNPAATLTDEAGNRAPAVILDLAPGAMPKDELTTCPNGAGKPSLSNK